MRWNSRVNRHCHSCSIVIVTGIRGTGSLVHFIEAIGFPKPALEQEGEEVGEGVELSVESDVPVA